MKQNQAITQMQAIIIIAVIAVAAIAGVWYYTTLPGPEPTPTPTATPTPTPTGTPTPTPTATPTPTPTPTPTATPDPAEVQEALEWAHTLVVAVADDKPSPSILEGWSTGSKISNMVSHRLWAALDPNNIGNQVCEDWTYYQDAEDRWVLDITIRQGLYWQDGTPVTAHDVYASWKYEGNSEGVQPYASVHRKLYINYTYLEVVHNHLFRVYCQDKLAWNDDIRQLMGGAAGELASAASLQNFKAGIPDPATGIVKDIGCGPYTIVEWVPEVKCVMERWDDFATPGKGGWVPGMQKQAGNVERVVFLFNVEPTAQRLGLETGEIDISLDGLDKPDALDLMEDDRFVVDYKPGGMMRFILVHWEEPFDDKRVRQAIAYALDNYEIVDILGKGYPLEVALSVCREVHNGWYPAWDEKYNVDNRVQMATDLLTDAGYPNGIDTEMYITPRGQEEWEKSLAAVVQALLERVGIRTEIKLVELAAFNDAMYGGIAPLGLRGWTNPPYTIHYDVGSQATIKYGSRYIYTGYAISGYAEKCASFQLIEDLVDQGLDLWQPGTQSQEWYDTYKQLQEVVTDEAVYFPMFFEPRVQCWQAYVKNYTHLMSYSWDAWSCWKELPADVQASTGLGSGPYDQIPDGW
jgi:ABC-type transport system substrate-binding protein